MDPGGANREPHRPYGESRSTASQDAQAVEIEAQRKALDDARIKEAADREKFCLE
jgi:hypothetical protein